MVGAIALSGALTGALGVAAQAAEQEAQRRKARRLFRRAWAPDPDGRWQQKVAGIAQRGFTLDALLTFYTGELLVAMPDFQARKHRTKDVVRRAIIPLSSNHRCALSEVMMNHQPTFPHRMVTHAWSSLFTDLVAAIVADALGETEYQELALLLRADVGQVVAWVRTKGVGGLTYWVCAFSVNQHAGICSSNPYEDTDPVSALVHPTCGCGAAKFFNSDGDLCRGKSIDCELNKFSDMMAYLSARDSGYSQVVAVDRRFEIFSRCWCMAEVAQAHSSGMRQQLKMPSAEALEENEERLRGLRVERMAATRPEDIAEILAGIPDKAEFDARLQSLISTGLLPNWRNLDGVEQAALLGRVARWQRMAETEYRF